MNAASNAMPMQPQIAAAEIPVSRQIYWGVRREFWENRAMFLALLAATALFVAGFVVTSVHLPQDVRAAAGLDSMKQAEAMAQPYDLAGAMTMGTFILVALFYCVETLQRERRDRSILFWKSLPVSDAITVGAKASIPLLWLPLFGLVISVIAQFIMMLMSMAVLAANGLSASSYWAQVSLPTMLLLLVYHVFTVHVLWSAPIYGWLMLVSAWARRAALLWAFVPPLAIVVMEKLIFNTTHFASFLEWRFWGGSTDSVAMPGTHPMNPMTHLTPLRYVANPELWVGLVATAVFLVLAARLRRSQEPI